MDEWQTMFAQVQSIIQAKQTLQESLNQLVAFTRRNPVVFDEPGFWDRVQTHDFRAAFATLTDWARQGMEALAPSSGWQFLLLDLGDCPETFSLYQLGGQELMSEKNLRAVLANNLVVGPSDLKKGFGPEVMNPFGHLFGDGRVSLSDHHVSETDDRLLDWTDHPENDFHGSNGYLLWLLLGSLALVEPLRDKNYCKTILRGRERIYLLPGYEEIFFFAATITADGILYEAV